jgi:excisionase family DNA binding protein
MTGADGDPEWPQELVAHQFITVSLLAAVLVLSKQTVYRMGESGDFRMLAMAPRTRRVETASVRDYILKRTTGGTPDASGFATVTTLALRWRLATPTVLRRIEAGELKAFRLTHSFRVYMSGAEAYEERAQGYRGAVEALTMDEVAARLRVTATTVARLARKGHFHMWLVTPHAARVDAASVERFLAKNTTGGVPDDSGFLTVPEVAVRWKVNDATVLRRIKSGDLKALRLGSQYRVYVSSVREFESANGTYPLRSFLTLEDIRRRTTGSRLLSEMQSG